MESVDSDGQPVRWRTTTVWKDADTRILEGDLSAAIGMAVSIEHHPTDGGGALRIGYGSLDELDRLCRKLTD